MTGGLVASSMPAVGPALEPRAGPKTRGRAPKRSAAARRWRTAEARFWGVPPSAGEDFRCTAGDDERRARTGAPPGAPVSARGLERDVVVRRRARARADRLGREVRRVGRDVRVRREAVVVAAGALAALAAVVAAAQELDGLGHDLDRLALGAVLSLPLAPVQAPVDTDGAALGQEARAVLTLGAPDGDAEVVGLVDPLAGGVLTPAVGGDAQRADAIARLEAPELRVARQIPREDDAVDVGCRHGGPALLSAFRTLCRRVYGRARRDPAKSPLPPHNRYELGTGRARQGAKPVRYPLRSGAVWRLASRARGAHWSESAAREVFNSGKAAQPADAPA